MGENGISEGISSHRNSSEVIYHIFYYNGKKLLNTEEEANVASIHSINANNDISMIYD